MSGSGGYPRGLLDPGPPPTNALMSQPAPSQGLLHPFMDYVASKARNFYDPQTGAYGGLAGMLGMPSALEQMNAGDMSHVLGFGGGIRAYHASPHNFAKFDISKVGSGQGAQSYGHGIYAAESPAVSGRGGAYDMEFTARNLGKHDLNQQETAILRGLRDGKSELDLLREQASMGSTFDEAHAAIDRVKKAAANIYELDINAPPQKFLDWDKPLGQQPKDVQDALRHFGFEYDAKAMSQFDDALLAALDGSGPATLPKQPPNPLGANIYESSKIVPGGYRDPAAASAALKERGILGIKYLDQGSRAAGGTSNYVIFDPGIIDILRKYGIAGGAVGLGLGANQ